MHILPRHAVILASYNCSAACEHCCFQSHPGIKQRLTLAQIKEFIQDASRLPSIELVAFSGGECFVLGKDLDEAVLYATSLGIRTRCVTNGYWAYTRVSAKRRLGTLARNGLKEINVSTGDFHQKFVPEDRVVNAVEVAVDLGVAAVVVVNATWAVGESLLEFHTRNAADFLKIWLAVDGPEQILAWAASKNSSINWENRYSHKCHACLALYKDPLVSSAIRDHYKERLDDVLLRYAIMARAHSRGTGYPGRRRRAKTGGKGSVGEAAEPSEPRNSGQPPTASSP